MLPVIRERIAFDRRIFMPEENQEQKPKTPIDFTHPSIGGIKVGHAVPEKGTKEIRFDHLDSRCVRRSPFWTDTEQPMAETGPAKSVENEDDARE
jgi:hypothetical protein